MHSENHAVTLPTRWALLDTRNFRCAMSFRRFTCSWLISTLVFSPVFAEPKGGAPETPAVNPRPEEPRVTFNSVHVDGPYVAMTFDDGPSEKLTPRLLDLLAERHIKATFFVIGENVAEHPEIVAREAREGHE